jgi:serine/threonine-protein kinase
VHRDLKPSNVMIDGRGQVRITDFGLAGIAEAFEGAEIRVGTPAYMSPEQIAGTEVTVRSDIYSLGLVLYELFTGKAAFVGKSVADLGRQHLETMPSTPSTVVPGFDPRVDRVILRCLDKDPSQRPATALAVVGALPGGDPLAAALEAGETPSPEMIAAAGESDAMSPGLAFGMLALVLLGIAGMLVLSPDYQALNRFEADKPPAALVFDARELIRAAGHEGEVADSTFGFGVNGSYQRHVAAESQEPDRWDDFGRVRPSPIVFWYRESPRPLVPTRATGSASFGNPPMAISGMARVQTDLRGRLQYFEFVPPQKGPSTEAPVDWGPLFASAQLDPARLAPAEPEWNPLIDCDARVAWTGSFSDQPDVPIRVEAGAFSGKPVYFQVIAPWTIPTRMQETTQAQAHAGNIISLTVISVLLGGGVLLARANLKRGRGDKRGAFVMAGYLFVVLLAQWALQVHHVKSFAELGMFADALQTGLLIGAIVWVIYVALEPYARRQWPHAMITWSRLLTGRFRDPLIGRDLLIGSSTGVVVSLLILLGGLIPGWMGQPGPDPVTNSVGTLGGLTDVAGIMLGLQPGAMIAPIGIFFLIFGVRLVVRKQWIAISFAFVLMSLVQGLQTQQTTVLGWVASAAVWAILIFVIVRFGILATLIAFVYANTLLVLPLTLDFAAWYADRMWFGLAVLAIVTGAGVYLALAGRPVFSAALLQDA